MADVETNSTRSYIDSGSLDSVPHKNRTLNGSYIMACGLDNEGSKNESVTEEKRSRNGGGSSHFYDNPLATEDSLTSNPDSASLEEDSDERLTNWIKSTSQTEYGTPPCDADRSLPAPANISDGIPLCRICHEDDADEDLVSPCFCSGSVGLLHMSCLEMWLGTSNTTKCEICQFQFSIFKKPRPYKWFLTNKRMGKERRYMIADFVCCLCFLPCTIATTIACLIGASYFSAVNKSWQGTSLILLATANICVFSIWAGFAIRRNYKLFKKWRGTYQTIKIRYNPPNKLSNVNSNSKIIATEVMEMDPQPRVSCILETDDVDDKAHVTAIHGTPWPRKKSNCAPTIRPETIAMSKLETSTPVNALRAQLMRRWGLNGCPVETPIPTDPRPGPIYLGPVGCMQNDRYLVECKRSFRDNHGYNDDSGMVCVTPLSPTPSPKFSEIPQTLIWKQHANPVVTATYPKPTYEISGGVRV